MTTKELDGWFSALLDSSRFSDADPSQNGLQVDNNGTDIKRIAFAVDACLETIERAASADAGMLFVHHGLFWKDSPLLIGSHYKRIQKLVTSNIALYACHLPLDANFEIGNNSGIARKIGLENIRPFGVWHGCEIGFRGSFFDRVGIDEILARLFPDGKKPLHVLPFGPKEIHSVGIISGGASDEIQQAIELKLDLYITGEVEHEMYHKALESRIHVIAGGHYQTETVGVRLVAERLGRETGLETLFLDIPTGL